MDIEIKTWLYDILNAIVEIDSFFEDQEKEFSVYKNDTRTRRAVERNIEIIGEATNRILQKIMPLSFQIPGRLSIPGTGSFMGMTLYQTK